MLTKIDDWINHNFKLITEQQWSGKSFLDLLERDVRKEVEGTTKYTGKIRQIPAVYFVGKTIARYRNNNRHICKSGDILLPCSWDYFCVPFGINYQGQVLEEGEKYKQLQQQGKFDIDLLLKITNSNIVYEMISCQVKTFETDLQEKYQNNNFYRELRKKYSKICDQLQYANFDQSAAIFQAYTKHTELIGQTIVTFGNRIEEIIVNRIKNKEKKILPQWWLVLWTHENTEPIVVGKKYENRRWSLYI